ncbi:MAG: polysaccharide deacetylase family protein [Proteobacteria bacterium]|nr:polysaccharide deacetylase family protein [Pseudomonadota bacterium]MBI3497938.1 polysaccharide deacetylase family protein [Pseudomonadota bacterium]
MRLVVLMYHRIAPDIPRMRGDLAVTPDRFARQMARLRQDGFTALRQDDVVAWLRGQRELPARPVVVTFDDGYADNLIHAFPVLERLEIPAITFLVTQRLGGQNDWDSGKLPTRQLMGASDVAAWAARGLEFGAHGRTHRSLVGLDAPTLRAEVDGSHDDLAKLLGRAPIAFAYPNGDVDVPAHEHVSRRFALGYGAHEGANWAETDPWELQRTSVFGFYPTLEFRCQIRLGWRPGNRLRNAFVRLARPLQFA